MGLYLLPINKRRVGIHNNLREDKRKLDTKLDGPSLYTILNVCLYIRVGNLCLV